MSFRRVGFGVHCIVALIAMICLCLAVRTQAKESLSTRLTCRARLFEERHDGFEGLLKLVWGIGGVQLAAESTGFQGELVISSLKFAESISDPVAGKCSDSPWRWASVTKQVVAVAVMQQVEAGRLELDTPVQRYAPDLGIANADRITIRQLLQHTSGLPNPDDGPQKNGQLIQYSRAAPKPAPGLSPICRANAKAEPGAGFSYNNCDYEVVGAVLETVTRTPLDRLLQQRIFGPAGMTRTRLLKPGEDAGRPGFDAAGKDDHAVDPGRFGAAAALAGPPSDLARFDRALMDGRLLKPETRTEMWRGNPKLGYAALGAWVYNVKLKGCATPQHLVERRGEIGNIQVRNIIAPDRDLAVIAFSDHPVEFGEPWMGKGLTYDLMSAALCPAVP